MKKRDDNIDMLRILCTLMVVLNHLLTWTGLLDQTPVMSSVWFLENVLFVFVLPAVNCFVLISGYYLSVSKFRVKKALSLWIQVFFYSVGLYLLSCFIDKDLTFNIVDFVKYCFIITLERYWFITAYFLLLLVSPFLNRMIDAMDQKTHKLCCVTLVGIFSFLSNIIYIHDFSGVNGGYSFLWFVVLYIAAAYIRRYVPSRVKYQRWMLPCAALCALMICAEKFLAYILTPYIFGSVAMDSLFYSYNSILAVPCALCLFQGFRGLEIRSKTAVTVIRFFAPLSFATYLIHAHMKFIGILLDYLNVTKYSDSFAVFPYMIICAIGVALVSCLIEWLRQRLFRLCKIDQVTGKLCDKIQGHVEKWLNASV